MLPTQKEVTVFARAIVAEMATWATERFDVDLTALKAQLTFKDCRRLGIAGCDNHGPVLRLNLGKYIKFETLGFAEYKSFAHYPTIGSFSTDSWQHSLTALAAHEMAHVVQWALKSGTFNPKQKLSTLYQGSVNVRGRNGHLSISHRFEGLGVFEGGHGDFFKAIYQVLRVKFVNHLDIKTRGPHQTFNETIEDKLAKAVKPEHHFMGMNVIYKGTVYTVKAMDPAKRKYRWIGVSTNGKRLNINDDFLNMYGKVAA